MSKFNILNLNYKIFIGLLLILLMLPLGYGYYQVQNDLSQIEIECNGFSDFDLNMMTVSAVMHNTVKNPTEREISIDLIQYQVFSNNTQVANGTIYELTIPAQTSTTLKNDIEIESGSIVNFLSKEIDQISNPKLIGKVIIHTPYYKEIEAIPIIGSIIGESKQNLIYIGYGSNNEISSVELDGKIALAKRGEVTFFWKYVNAEVAGAEGIIVFNNEPGLFQETIFHYNRHIPIVAISQEDGEEILQTIENGMTVSVIIEEQKDELLALIIKGTMTKKFWFVDLNIPFEIPNQCNFNPN